MIHKSPRAEFSTNVSISLHVEGQEYDVAQVGPDSLLLREQQRVPLGEAKLVIVENGDRSEYTLLLHSQIADSGEVSFF